MRRFPAPRLPAVGDHVQLDAPTSHHVLRVTLVPRGTAVVIFDGSGQECTGELVDVQHGRAVIQATAAPRPVQAAQAVHLVLGLPRKPAVDRILRMATELGLTDLHPVVARHSVATGVKVERWTRLMEQAARQSGRGDVPTLHPVRPVADALAAVTAPTRLVLTPGTAPAAPGADGGLGLFIGPEGGLHPDEVDAALELGWTPAGLGPWVLRSDTAVVAALSRYGVRAPRS